MSARTPEKTFVIDTSVILHDARSVLAFAEHDVAIPVTVLEEVDRFKGSSEDKGAQAREFARILDEVSDAHGIFNGGAPIHPNDPNSGRLRIVNDRAIKMKRRSTAREDAAQIFGRQSDDNRILTTAVRLKEQGSSGEVILVTNDKMLKIKAKGAYGLKAQEYLRAAVEDIKSISVDDRKLRVEDAVINQLISSQSVPWSEILPEIPLPHQYFILASDKTNCLATFDPTEEVIHLVKSEVTCGIKARNAEQAFALNAVLDEKITLVALNGKAGTGKTLMAIAAAMHQKSNFRQILVARPLVSLSDKDIGYLPGDISDKVGPHMEAIWDNYRVLMHQHNDGSPDQKKLLEARIKEKISVLPLAFIRGRSFTRTMVIVDESQNLTPIEVKTIVTRAGEGTKVVFTGDIFQIDSPYLNVNTNGLSYLIERMRRKRIGFFAHVNMRKGERSPMSEVAADVL